MTLRPIPLLCLAFFSLAHAESDYLTYTCDDGTRFDVAFSADNDGRPQASLRFAGRELMLPQVIAASGASYKSGDAALHTKEEKALFSDGKSRLRSCQQANSTPAAVATPLPPLKLRKTGYRWPKNTDMATRPMNSELRPLAGQ